MYLVDLRWLADIECSNSVKVRELLRITRLTIINKLVYWYWNMYICLCMQVCMYVCMMYVCMMYVWMYDVCNVCMYDVCMDV